MTTEVLLPRQQGPKGVFSTQQTGDPSDIMVAILSSDSTQGFPSQFPILEGGGGGGGGGTVLKYTHPENLWTDCCTL